MISDCIARYGQHLTAGVYRRGVNGLPLLGVTCVMCCTMENIAGLMISSAQVGGIPLVT
jgi:hypothetical protein